MVYKHLGKSVSFTQLPVFPWGVVLEELTGTVSLVLEVSHIMRNSNLNDFGFDDLPLVPLRDCGADAWEAQH